MTKEQKVTRYTAIFKEWTRRYEENPASFPGYLDEDGNVVADYAEASALYFNEIEDELFEQELKS